MTLVDRTICDEVVAEVVLEVIDGVECVELVVDEPEDVGMLKRIEGKGTTVK
jgi:hypothetical protein